MNNDKVLPPAYLLLAIIVMIGLHFVFPIMTIVSLPWNLLGIIPLVVGVVANIIADNAFKRANTTIKPFAESTALVTSGVYQVSRNPMYLGFVLVLAGIAILLGSLSPYIVISVFVILIERNFIRIEEEGPAQKCGRQWLEYQQRVRRCV
ncbi:MAG: isoprenylcysteine carboxylmethyltransferase family protein [Chloroflexi bacterium]|nr:isoprenylcysteine carboxylmethyltransferase family protein [Chloroflexota bacterium]